MTTLATAVAACDVPDGRARHWTGGNPTTAQRLWLRDAAFRPRDAGTV